MKLETDRLEIRDFQMQDLDAIQRTVFADPAVAIPFAGRTRELEDTKLWLITHIWQVTGGWQEPGSTPLCGKRTAS